MKATQKQRTKAAKKAARTRAANRAQMKYIEEVVRPGMDRFQCVLNHLLANHPAAIRLRWNPTRDTDRRLRHGVQYGTLVGFENGNLLCVLPEGYKRPQTFHPAFWELSL